jgi:nucleotide-binding universal stress UspA family protein
VTELFQRALVSVGPAPDADALIRYARLLPLLDPGVEIQFLHVMGWPGRSAGLQSPVTYGQALARLEEAAARHFGRGGRVQCRVLNGELVDTVLETAVEWCADLILVGHGAGAQGRRSLARRLAMKAPCSVWMRPDSPAFTVRRVLAAVDYSPHSAFALSTAALIAHRAGGSCLALHVSFDDAARGGQSQGEICGLQRDAFSRFAAPVDTSGVAVEPVFAQSADVAHAVARVSGAEEVDLVVMGSRGRSPSTSILLGSESEHVLMESRVPVLIAKRKGERIGLLQALFDRDFSLHEPPRFG